MTGLLVSTPRPIPILIDTGEYWLIPDTGIGLTLPTTPGHSLVCSNLGPPLRGLPNRHPNFWPSFGWLPTSLYCTTLFSGNISWTACLIDHNFTVAGFLSANWKRFSLSLVFTDFLSSSLATSLVFIPHTNIPAICEVCPWHFVKHYCLSFSSLLIIVTIIITTGESNLTTGPHCSSTWMVQWYLPGGANVRSNQT